MWWWWLNSGISNSGAALDTWATSSTVFICLLSLSPIYIAQTVLILSVLLRKSWAPPSITWARAQLVLLFWFVPMLAEVRVSVRSSGWPCTCPCFASVSLSARFTVVFYCACHWTDIFNNHWSKPFMNSEITGHPGHAQGPYGWPEIWWCSRQTFEFGFAHSAFLGSSSPSSMVVLRPQRLTESERELWGWDVQVREHQIIHPWFLHGSKIPVSLGTSCHWFFFFFFTVICLGLTGLPVRPSTLHSHCLTEKPSDQWSQPESCFVATPSL